MDKMQLHNLDESENAILKVGGEMHNWSNMSSTFIGDTLSLSY